MEVATQIWEIIDPEELIVGGVTTMVLPLWIHGLHGLSDLEDYQTKGYADSCDVCHVRHARPLQR